MLRINRVGDLFHQPLDLGINHRALVQVAVALFEALLAVGRARGLGHALGGRTTDHQGAGVGDHRLLLEVAVAVLTSNLDSRLDLGSHGAIAVGILTEVAVHTVHATLGVDVHQVHRLAILRCEGGLRISGHFAQLGQDPLELGGIVVGNDVAVLVQEVALAVRLEHRAEHPTVAVVVRELRVLEVLVQIRHVLKERAIAPQSTLCSTFRIAIQTLVVLIIRELLSLLRPHALAIRLVRPHLVAVERVDERVRLVHVTHHALTRRDAVGELVSDGVARLVLRDGRIRVVLRITLVPERRVNPRVNRVAIVGIHHVARGATARAVITRLIIGAQERQVRIVQARLVHVQQRQVDAVQCPQTTIRQAVVRTTRVLELVRQTYRRRRQAILSQRHRAQAAALFEDTEEVRGLRGFEARQRQEEARP